MTTSSQEEDETLANFLESEVLSEVSDQEEAELTRPRKMFRLDETSTSLSSVLKVGFESQSSREISQVSRRWNNSCWQIETGIFSKIPSELFHHILKFLSSEDLISCSRVCRFLNFVASDESLWRRLYCMRWGLSSQTWKIRACAWKKLYIQRDEEDMVVFVRNTPSEFKEYYIQMQAAKRIQAPLPSQVNDDRVILDRTVADQVSIWKNSRGLTDEAVANHVCSGNTCSYSQIGDVFLCDKTGRIHVCDDTCRETVLDSSSGGLVCTISGHCFDRFVSLEEESDAEQQQGGVMDEAEPFMGSGYFGKKNVFACMNLFLVPVYHALIFLVITALMRRSWKRH